MEDQYIQVECAKPYQIIITQNNLPLFTSYLVSNAEQQKIFIVTDQNVAKLHLDQLITALQLTNLSYFVFTMEPGEGSKCFTQLEQLISQILSKQPERGSVIIAFGGGVVGDLAGLAASLILRGIRLMHVPTSLLAQVDSAIGGKTAINSKFGKNLIGTIYQPELVFTDLAYLETLPMREWIAGYAEIVKYAVINNREFFFWLVKHEDLIKKRDPLTIQTCISFSCNSKAKIVASDEYEQNQRLLLNFGHSFAHALEAETGFSEQLLHGEAVAIGMCMALFYSYSQGMMDKSEYDMLCNHLQKIGLPTSPLDIKLDWNINQLVATMFHDKKVKNQSLRLILAKEIGECRIVDKISYEMVYNCYVTFFNQIK